MEFPDYEEMFGLAQDTPIVKKALNDSSLAEVLKGLILEYGRKGKPLPRAFLPVLLELMQNSLTIQQLKRQLLPLDIQSALSPSDFSPQPLSVDKRRKLRPEQVKQLRQLSACANAPSLRQLAKDVGIAPSTLSKALRGHSWKNLT